MQTQKEMCKACSPTYKWC